MKIGDKVPEPINLVGGKVQGYYIDGRKKSLFSSYIIKGSIVGQIEGEYFQLKNDLNTSLWFKISDFEKETFTVEQLQKSDNIGVKIENKEQEDKVEEIFRASTNWKKYYGIPNLPNCSYPYYRRNGTNWDRDSKYFEKHGIKIINFDQIKFPEMKEVLKYVVIKSFPSVQGGYYLIGDEIGKENDYFAIAETALEFFKPVFEPSFKEGDIFINHSGKLCKVKELRLNKDRKDYDIVSVEGTVSYITSCHHAAKEQIEIYNSVIKIDSYTAQKEDDKIAFGCVKLDKTKLEAYLYLLQSEAKATITVKGVAITEEIIQKLLKKLI